MKNMKLAKYILSAALLAAGFTSLKAQDDLILNIKGKVLDEFGQPIYNALVVTENEDNEYLTNRDGSFDFRITDGSHMVKVIATGYKDKWVRISEIMDSESAIDMEYDSAKADEMVNIGFFEVRRNDITGSVSTVSGKELQRSPTLRFDESLVGRLLGLESQELNGNPCMNVLSTVTSVKNMTFNIRGAHSINYNNNQSLGYPGYTLIIDGVMYKSSDFDAYGFSFLNPREIESVTVLRDAATQAIFGIGASDGVLNITTKRGHQGEPRVTVSYDHTLRQPSTERYVPYSSYDHAMMRNQAAINDGLKPIFTEEEMAWMKTENRDWYNEYLKPFSQMDRAFLQIGGGSENVHYMANLGYTHTNPLYNIPEGANPGYKIGASECNYFHLASNLDAKLNHFISVQFTLRSDFKIENGLGTAANMSYRIDNADFYQHILVYAPTMRYMTMPEGTYVEGYNVGGYPVFSQNATMAGLYGAQYPINPYGEMAMSGYANAYSTFIHMDTKVNFDLYMIAEGLKAEAAFVYKGGGTKNIDYSRNYTMYVATDGSMQEFEQYGGYLATNARFSKTYTFCYSYDYFARLYYNHKFGDHGINAFAYGDYREEITRDIGSKTSVPYRTENFGLYGAYSYKDKYLANLSLGYSGSGDFDPDNRFFFTPAVGLGWVASNEEFLKHSDFLTYFKLRGEYGITARDRFNQDRFSYMSAVSYGSWNTGAIGNPNIEPEFIRSREVGADITLWNSLNLTASVFKENVDNCYVNGTSLIPMYQGIALGNYPYANIGKLENQGYELGVNYIGKINKDWTVNLGGTFTNNHNMVLYSAEVPKDEDYYNRYLVQGQPVGAIMGYRIDYEASTTGNGLYNSQEEIENSGLDYTALGTIRPGDFIYKDLNEDGKIDAKDKDFFKYPSMPEQYFTFNAGIKFKNLELNALFTGATHVCAVIGDQFSYGCNWDGFYMDMHKNAWTAEKYAAGELIDAPALATKMSPSHQNNDYWVADGSYLKLRNVELAYTFPMKAVQKLGVQDIRLSLSGQNLATWDRLPSKQVDPEVRTMGMFQPYKCYNAGVSITF